MKISDIQHDEVIYHRWTLIIPILITIIGLVLLYGVGPSNNSIGLIGGLITLVGILTFGALFSIILGIELASRTIEKQIHNQPSFREKIDTYEQSNEKKGNNEG